MHGDDANPVGLKCGSRFHAQHVEPGFGDAGAAAFPRAQLLFWEDVTPEMKQELRELGYTAEDLEFFDEVDSYWGYRTAIDVNGNWQYFVAGD